MNWLPVPSTNYGLNAGELSMFSTLLHTIPSHRTAQGFQQLVR